MILPFRGLGLSQEELDQYYLRKRISYYKKYGAVPRHIRLHNALHWLLIPCVAFLRKLKGIQLTMICDERIKTKGPIIYACTHAGGVDIETAFEAIEKPCWLFLSNPKEVYRNIDGLMLGINGAICLELNNKQDRHIAKETAIGLLKNGGNLLIFPEGAWNIIVNQLVMRMFPGTAEMALRSRAQIIPIALEG